MNKLNIPKADGSYLVFGDKLPDSGMGHDEFLYCSEFEGGQYVVSRFKIDNFTRRTSGGEPASLETTCIGQIVYEAPQDEFSIPQGGGKSSHPLAVRALKRVGL